MPTIAYLANLFPTPVEPYVKEEILELRRRGIRVLPCSIRRPSQLPDDLKQLSEETNYLLPLDSGLLVKASWLLLRKVPCLSDLWKRVLLQGGETPWRRARTLLHTWLGACLAVRLAVESVDHIHVHHGYFGSWVAMVAARLLDVPFSITLHGSDLLLHPAYLDTKLASCSFCVTVSNFNRQYLLHKYPKIDEQKILVRRMGVDCQASANFIKKTQQPFTILAVGRLHPVKDHKFLIQACRLIKDRRLHFICKIVGEGPEHAKLEQMIARLGLRGIVDLLGQVPREQLAEHYRAADVLVLTSRSEGIPLVLMEGMSAGAVVLAPAITGIPELVSDGESGFLYRSGSLESFVTKVEEIQKRSADLNDVRRAAYEHVLEHFNRTANLAAFCDCMIRHLKRFRSDPFILQTHGAPIRENPVLQ